MHMIASGDGVTLTSDAARHTPWPGVAFRQIDDETEQARFIAIWSPNNRSPALLNLLDIAANIGKTKSFLPSIHIDITAPTLPPD